MRDEPRSAVPHSGESLARRLERLWSEGQAPDVHALLSGGSYSAAELGEALAVDQRWRWRRGERVPAEAYLQAFPAVRDDAERVLDLVYGEFFLREKRGEAPDVEVFARRFPDLAARLREQVRLHRAMEAVAGESTLPGRRDTSGPAAGDARLPGGLVPPPSLAGYEILGELGRGGMGVVYKARHRLMERTVALKVIHRRLLAGHEPVERFEREVKAAAALNHPNVVTAFDAVQVGDEHVLVMEFVAGVTLAQLVERDGPLPVGIACDYARQAALGLQHAFEQGLVHRDIKPQNLMLTPQGRVKVLDFGLARLHRGEPGALTASGMVMGTPDYLAPEQAADPRAADIRADLYSLGCTLYFLLVGQPPFPGGTFVQKLEAHARKAPPPLCRRRPEVPAGLARVVERLLAKDPARRYQSPAEVAAALEPFTRPVSPARPDTGRARSIVLKASVGTVGCALTVSTALVGLSIALPVFERWRAPDPAPVKPDTGAAPKPLPGDQPPPAATTEIEEIRRIRAGPNRIGALALSPDGEVLATGGDDGVLRLWDTATLQEQHTFKGHRTSLLAVAISPRGDAVACGGYDPAVRCWDAATGKALPTFDGWSGAVRALVFAPDGQTLYGGCEEGRLRRFDVKTGQGRTLAALGCMVRAMALAPDGRTLAVSLWETAGTIRLWDPEANKDKGQLEATQGEYAALAVDRTGTLIAGGGLAKHLKVWKTDTCKVWREIPGPHPAWILGAAFPPDGKWLVSVDGSFQDPEAPCALTLWDVESAREVRRLRLEHGCFYKVVFAPDGRSCYACLHDGTVRQYRLPLPPDSSPAAARKDLAPTGK
jgi:serine/threonine protein kinase